MRAKFTSTVAEIDQAGGVYQKDDSLEDWIRGAESTSAFWVTVIMPFIRKFTNQECDGKIFRATQAVQEDTKWPLRKMARRQLPEDQRWPNLNTSPEHQEGVDGGKSTHEVVARERDAPMGDIVVRIF